MPMKQPIQQLAFYGKNEEMRCIPDDLSVDDLDARDSRGMSALAYACLMHNVQCVSILISKGADINHYAPGVSLPAICHLIMLGDVESVLIALAYGATLDYNTTHCPSFKMLLSRRGSTSISNVIEKHVRAQHKFASCSSVRLWTTVQNSGDEQKQQHMN